jgi:aminopeptidase N
MAHTISGQSVLKESLHKCQHHCAHQNTKNNSIGIYNQDERVHHYDVKYYGLDISVQPWNTQIEGSLTLVAEIVEDQTRFLVLELLDQLTVTNVSVNGLPLSYEHTDNIVVIDLGSEYSAGTLVSSQIFYHGEPTSSGFFNGIQSQDNGLGDPVLWTLSEPHNARQWFPCKQVLGDKADSVHIAITTPQGFVAASNGLLQNTTLLPDDKIRYEWKSNYPIAYYLISMAVANYQEYNFYAPLNNNSDSVLVQNFIYNQSGVLENNKEIIDKTAPMISLMSDLWGNYPFASEKYGHAMAPMGGAMEHQTISTMGYFGFDITAHELAHHWFGNNVTCATWNDIWINEGFASYGEFLSREFLLGIESANQWMVSAHNNVKSFPNGSVYVPKMELSDVFRIFNGRLSYKKGAAILHQLRFELNDDALFFTIMEDFQTAFADSIATGDDFRRMIDLATESSWEWFFDQWYYGEGYPVYELKWWQENNQLFIRSAQSTSANFPEFFKGTIEFKVITNETEETFRVFQNEVLQTFEFNVTGTVKEIVFDPRKFMLQNHTIWDSTETGNIPVKKINVYPNPVRDKLTIELPLAHQGGRFYLHDSRGRKISEFSETHNNVLDFSALSEGLYFLTIESDKGNREIVKIMKSK